MPPPAGPRKIAVPPLPSGSAVKLLEALESRRAVRDFAADAIGEPVLNELVRAAAAAPSYMNLQPWTFAVVSDPLTVARLGERALQHQHLKPHELEGFRLAHGGDGLPSHSAFYNAPALIVIYANDEGRHAEYGCAMAAQSLMLAAQTMGLGTCWISQAQPFLNSPAMKKAFGVPLNCKVIAPIIVGCPSGQPLSPGRRQPDIHWVRPRVLDAVEA